MSSKGSDYVRAAYQWPVGYRGWTLGLNGSHLNYKVTDVAFTALPLRGSANAFGLETTYPVTWRSRYKLNAVLGWDVKTYENLRSEEVVTSYNTRAVNAGLQGQFFDDWAGGGISTWQFMGAGGRLKKKTDTSDSLNTGHFEKIKYNFTRVQDLSSSMSLHASLNGQISKTHLDSSEKFYLGGMSGVRAYPSSEAGGSAGRLLNIEFRHRLNINNTWFAFYDHGRVVVDPYSSAALNAFELKGYGVGYGFVSVNGISLKAMVARRLGHNPNPTSTGQDQDGSLAMNRFWLNANLAF
jgi:hemolysin activation/secretion protein